MSRRDYTGAIDKSANRLIEFIRSQVKGQCLILTEGQACQCLLCDVSRLAGMALEWNKKQLDTTED